MSFNVDDYIKTVPRRDRHKLDMVVDFKEKYCDGSLIEEHLYEISLVMDGWEGEVAKQLELGRKTRAEIKKNHGSLDDQKYVLSVKCTTLLIILLYYDYVR